MADAGRLSHCAMCSETAVPRRKVPCSHTEHAFAACRCQMGDLHGRLDVPLAAPSLQNAQRDGGIEQEGALPVAHGAVSFLRPREAYQRPQHRGVGARALPPRKGLLRPLRRTGTQLDQKSASGRHSRWRIVK